MRLKYSHYLYETELHITRTIVSIFLQNMEKKSKKVSLLQSFKAFNEPCAGFRRGSAPAVVFNPSCESPGTAWEDIQ